MAGEVVVTPSAGGDVPLGTVNLPELALTFNSSTGRMQLQAPQLSITRPFGQKKDDPADSVFFKQLAGKGHGEIQEAKVAVTYKHRQTLKDVGTLTLEGASVQFYQEKDTGDDVCIATILRAEKVVYAPSQGGQTIEIDFVEDKTEAKNAKP